jgi:hypothetical protein
VLGDLGDSHPAYRSWYKDANDYREQRYGPLRRQLAYVRRMIPAAMVEAQRTGFTLLGAFDRFQPHLSGHAVWFLQSRSDEELSADIDTAPVRKSAVNDGGSIFPTHCKEFEPYTDTSPPFWLVTYLLEPAQSHEFVMKRSKREAIGTAIVKDIILDAVLKAAESRLG